jgi:hypothetical protein
MMVWFSVFYHGFVPVLIGLFFASVQESPLGGVAVGAGAFLCTWAFRWLSDV